VANSLDGLLGFTDGDLAANRNGVLSGRQALRLWLSGGWRALVGPLLAVAGAAATLVSDYFLFAALGLIALIAGLYLAWRGFAFLADAATVDTAFVTGPLNREVVTNRNSRTYYALIGPIRKRVSRKNYDALPVGTVCNLYYAPGCRSLLSAEPAGVGEPRPAHPFGPDADHAWDRLRWRWVVLTVAVFGIFAGGHVLVDAHPAVAVRVGGTVANYYQTHGKSSTTEHLVLAGDDSDYRPSHPDGYAPPIDSYQRLVGSAVVLYVNGGTTDVIAIQDAEILHAGDYYLHPEHQLFWTLLGGVVLLLVSLLALYFAGRPLVRVWRRAAPTAGPTAPARLSPPTVRPLHLAWPAALVLLGLQAGAVALAAGFTNLSWASTPDVRQVLALAAGVLLVAGAVGSLARFRTRASG
jgi:hypothetical protein